MRAAEVASEHVEAARTRSVACIRYAREGDDDARNNHVPVRKTCSFDSVVEGERARGRQPVAVPTRSPPLVHHKFAQPWSRARFEFARYEATAATKRSCNSKSPAIRTSVIHVLSQPRHLRAAEVHGECASRSQRT